jgi:peptide deformylase
MKLVHPQNPVLRKTATAKTIPIDILQEMKEYVESNPSCVGLAAPQIGYSVRVFVMKDSKGNVEIIHDPWICSHSPETNIAIEGCLSLPNYKRNVKRYNWISVRYTNDDNGDVINATYEGVDARVFQHEYDHLNGLLINGMMK